MLWGSLEKSLMFSQFLPAISSSHWESVHQFLLGAIQIKKSLESIWLAPPNSVDINNQLGGFSPTHLNKHESKFKDRAEHKKCLKPPPSRGHDGKKNKLHALPSRSLTASLPLKRYRKPNRKGSSSNHHFSGASC